jgi:hypothetical protein
MASPTPTELKAFIRICAGTARDLKKALRAEQIYVATGSTTSAVPFSHLTKAVQVHAAVLTLCRNGFGSEAFALSRLILEMSMALRWITNQDQVKRSDSFAFFEAKRKLYFAMIYEKGNSTRTGAVQYVENLYQHFIDMYDSFKFWSNVPNNLRAMAAEPEILYGQMAPQFNDDLWHYDVPYSMASDHVHCTAVAMAGAFPPINAPYEVVNSEEPSLVKHAAFSATQWLFYIMKRVDAYRGLDMEAQIYTAYKPFEAFINTRFA